MLKKAALAGVAAFALLQTIRPGVPDAPPSVEFVRIAGQGIEYRRFADEWLREDTAAESRASADLGLTPAWLP